MVEAGLNPGVIASIAIEATSAVNLGALFPSVIGIAEVDHEPSTTMRAPRKVHRARRMVHRALGRVLRSRVKPTKAPVRLRRELVSDGSEHVGPRGDCARASRAAVGDARRRMRLGYPWTCDDRPA
jgi:hypothetical protein